MPAEQALEFWRESLSRSWEMDIQPQHMPAFQAEVAMWKADCLLVGSSTFGPTQTRVRRDANIRQDQLDHYRLIMLREGQFRCEAGGQEVTLSPGRFVITDMAAPELNVSCCKASILYVPRDVLESALPRPVRLHGASPVNACADLLSGHLSSLLNAMPQMSGPEVAGVTRATVNLLAASLAQSPDNLDAAQPAIDSVMLRRVRQYIAQNLVDERLSVEQICAHLRVSRSTLYRLFVHLGGIADYIRERRLARVHQILSSGQHLRQNLAHLAEQNGFRSATQFSRAFKQQFGYSPSEATGQIGAVVQGASAHSASRFDRWLETLES